MHTFIRLNATQEFKFLKMLELIFYSFFVENFKTRS